MIMNYRYNNIRPPRRPLHTRTRLNVSWVLIPVALVFLVVGVVGCRSVYQNTEQTVETVVLGKERVCDSNGDSVECQYLVFTEDGTFKLTDSTGLLSGKTRFSTSDVYGRIRVDQPATITSMGWRIPVLSEYRNIIEITQP